MLFRAGLPLTALVLASCTPKSKPISLHPDNPHYFLFNGKPTVLIGSTEHYGALINLDFDYIKYFDELSACRLNVTRTFSGVYVEPLGAFGIADNTLAPDSGRFICPWARSSEAGYNGGGNKFDLGRWDTAYFTRLKHFITEAGKRNIVVELDLFSNIYDTPQWKLSPLYADNNVNNLPLVADHKEILALKHTEIVKIQEEMVRKILKELNEFDNLYYEICNEPYFGDIAALNTWEKHMTNVAVDAEKELPNQHLFSHNIANGSEKIENPHPGVSVFNFHYAKPPVAVSLNYHLNKPIGDNETGFNGIEDVHYRTEAWDFLVAGGALYNNLDYSFTTHHPAGDFTVVEGQPGGGGLSLRNQLKFLKEVFDAFDYIHAKPSDSIITSTLPGNATMRVLSTPQGQYLFYINNAFVEKLNYSLRFTGWLSAPVTGKYWIYTVSDDGVRLMLDNKTIIENWTDHGSTIDSTLVNLFAGKKFPIKLEFYQGLGGAVLNLRWKPVTGELTDIPGSSFTAADGKTPGLTIEKFNDKELKKKSDEAIVTTISAEGIPVTEQEKTKAFEIVIDLPAGDYMGEWIDTKNGNRTAFPVHDHPGGEVHLSTPSFIEDIALLIRLE